MRAWLRVLLLATNAWSASGFVVARAVTSSSAHLVCCRSPSRALVGASADEEITPAVGDTPPEGESAALEESVPAAIYDATESAEALFDDEEADSASPAQPVSYDSTESAEVRFDDNESGAVPPAASDS